MSALLDRFDAKGPKKILSLDGGGIRPVCPENPAAKRAESASCLAPRGVGILDVMPVFGNQQPVGPARPGVVRRAVQR